MPFTAPVLVALSLIHISHPDHSDSKECRKKHYGKSGVISLSGQGIDWVGRNDINDGILKGNTLLSLLFQLGCLFALGLADLQSLCADAKCSCRNAAYHCCNRGCGQEDRQYKGRDLSKVLA